MSLCLAPMASVSGACHANEFLRIIMSWELRLWPAKGTFWRTVQKTPVCLLKDMQMNELVVKALAVAKFWTLLHNKT